MAHQNPNSEGYQDCVRYVPAELVGSPGKGSEALYHYYLLELHPQFDDGILPDDIILAVRTRLENDDQETMKFELDVDRGRLEVQLKYAGSITLDSEKVLLCQEFQITVFRAMLDRDLKQVPEAIDRLHQNKETVVFDYLLLPAIGSRQNPSINWECVKSVQFHRKDISDQHVHAWAARGDDHDHYVQTQNGLVCCCILENSLVCTPHNDYLYRITGTFDKLNGKSMMRKKKGKSISYQSHYEKSDINLHFVEQCLLKGAHMFNLQNYLNKSRIQKGKGPSISSGGVELPPELCSVIMSISTASFYSFSYAPSIMHRIESFLVAANLKRLLVDQCFLNALIPTSTVLDAITTKECQENFHFKSLATFGDSFLKYAVSKQLFKTCPELSKGPLADKRRKIIDNDPLCKRGCDRHISGFIRNEAFDPQLWIIPGDNSGTHRLKKQVLPGGTRIVYYMKQERKMKNKRVADVVESLIGVFLVDGGETAALSFLEWLGIKVRSRCIPISTPLPVKPEELINVKFLEEDILKNRYKFRDASLLVEALTHGSYKLGEITTYKRLEFLGDAVLDYLVTKQLYSEHQHSDLSPGLLTDLRSASVNNDFYSTCAVRAGLHKHILVSQDMKSRIDEAVSNFERSDMVSGSTKVLPEVLADIIESLAAAILVDCGYDIDIVLQSMRPLLATPNGPWRN